MRDAGNRRLESGRKGAHTARKGQVWTVDFVTGTVALAFILIAFILIWNTMALRWSIIKDYSAMETSAFLASESLLGTPGHPASWEMLPIIDDEVKAVGLVRGRNELSRMKLDRLAGSNSTSYDFIKERLGLQRYEFGLRVTDLDGNEGEYEFGVFSSGQLNDSVVFDRFAILDGEPVVVHMEVWSR